jgi:unsaturated rhamnogalacturonyl hydrolase
VLEVLPAGHPGRPGIVAIVQALLAGVTRHQDAQTGRWFQVIDKGSDPGNWLETSCSAMLTYSLSRAVQRGYLAPNYADVVAKAYQGVMQKVSLGSDGLTNIVDISVGTSVGSLAYYYGRTRASNDFHGLGAFLIMLEQLRDGCR